MNDVRQRHKCLHHECCEPEPEPLCAHPDGCGLVAEPGDIYCADCRSAVERGPASRETQHGYYLDCGPGNWDDRD